MFDLSACYVERNREGDYNLHWRGSQPGQRIAVYMADSADAYYEGAHPGEPLLYTTEPEVLITNPDKSIRHYFYLEAESGEAAVLAERQLPLEGAPNFRDLGGYETYDGRRTKWGRLYRSSKLSDLSDADLQRVHRLGITLVCDFRQLLEQELEPSRLSLGHPSQHASLPVTPGSLKSFLDELQSGVIAVDDSAKLMQEINRELVSHQMPQYAEMFRLLLLEDQQILIHCASGKDRTGFGAALILDVLGVEEDRIVEDYLLTNKYLALEENIEQLSQVVADQSGEPVPREVLEPLLQVRPEYIAACFEEIRKRYDSKEHFFETALNLDEDKLAILRERYLHD
ncbi:MAG: tyrosine-protein phosphatase [Halieaceae bacterium]|nr:tyrosine-protein phosphatase [Halieaceae bacterium]